MLGFSTCRSLTGSARGTRITGRQKRRMSWREGALLAATGGGTGGACAAAAATAATACSALPGGAAGPSAGSAAPLCASSRVARRCRACGCVGALSWLAARPGCWTCFLRAGSALRLQAVRPGERAVTIAPCFDSLLLPCPDHHKRLTMRCDERTTVRNAGRLQLDGQLCRRLSRATHCLQMPAGSPGSEATACPASYQCHSLASCQALHRVRALYTCKKLVKE